MNHECGRIWGIAQLGIGQPHLGIVQRHFRDRAAAFGDRAVAFGDRAAAFGDRTIGNRAEAFGIAVLGIVQPCGRPSQSSSPSQTSVT